MVNCLIVDDEQHSIDVLTHHVNKTEGLHLVGATMNATHAITLINNNKIDLLFQDVHMPDLSGLDVIKIINGKCHTIVTTAHAGYALDGYELGVVDYLLKPISYPRFVQAVQKVISQSQQNVAMIPQKTTEFSDSFIYVKTGVKNNVIKIILDEIDYIECVKNYANIYHAGQSTLVYISMKDMEASLPLSQFIRVHRTYIIPLSKIIRIDGSFIFLKNVKDSIPLGDTYRSALWQIVNNKVIG